MRRGDARHMVRLTLAAGEPDRDRPRVVLVIGWTSHAIPATPVLVEEITPPKEQKP